MASARPDEITLSRHRDLEGRDNEVWVRRGILVLLAVMPVLAAVNVFGQRASTSRAAVQEAELRVHAPSAVRPGLIYQAVFLVSARSELRDAALVLHSDWVDGMTVNSIVPNPVSETSQNGSLRLELGPIQAGQTYKLLVYYQVNPTTSGRKSQDVGLVDGDQRLGSVHRTMTVFP
jgi:hypothetical protein